MPWHRRQREWKALKENQKAFITVGWGVRWRAPRTEKLSRGYFVVIPARVENFHYTFCVCMKHFSFLFFHFGVVPRCSRWRRKFHFFRVFFSSLWLMNCSQMNTSVCLIIPLVLKKLEFMKSFRKQVWMEKVFHFMRWKVRKKILFVRWSVEESFVWICNFTR